MVRKLLEERPFYEFGHYRLDVLQRILLRDGQLIPLPPKTYDLLLTLVETGGMVVSKEELLERVWPDTFVEEGSLTQNISTLRKALGEKAGGPQYIQTVPKRGYRFVAAVMPTQAAPDSQFADPAVDLEHQASHDARPTMPPTRPSHWGLAGAPRRGSPFIAAVEQPETTGLETVTPKPAGWRTAAICCAAVLMVVAGLAASMRSKPKLLTDKDAVVLADFTNSTGDPVFDGILRDAFAYQLEQSPLLKVVDDEVMRQDLQLMRRSPQERITNDLAHDICIREGEKAMIGGSIAKLNRSYAIEIKATVCESGRILAREQAEAADKDHVLRAIAEAAREVRAKLGESLSTIQSLGPPEMQVTTNSLDAFRAFASGQRLFQQGRLSEAVPFLRRATELDPGLAMAYHWLASALLTQGDDPREVQEYADKAYALRDRVSAYERFWISRPGYMRASSSDALRNLELWAVTYPRDPAPLVFSALIYNQMGHFEEALRRDAEAHWLQPRRPLYAPLVMGDYVRLDRYAEAKATAAEHFHQGFDNGMVHQWLLRIAWIEGDEQAAALQLAWFAGRPEESVALGDQALHAEMAGRLRESRELIERSVSLAQQRGLTQAVARIRESAADTEALRGNCAPARSAFAASPAFTTLSDRLATLAFCGDAVMEKRAQHRAQEISRDRAADVLWSEAQLPSVRAAIEYRRGNPREAVDLLQTVKMYERALPFAVYLRGLAFLKLKQGRDAAMEFRNLTDHKGANWGPLYPLAWLGLARASALEGDTAGAGNAYREFLAYWKNADSEIPVLDQARMEYEQLQ